MKYFFASLVLHLFAMFIYLLNDANKINYLTEQIKKKSKKETKKIITNPNYKIRRIYKQNKFNFKNKNKNLHKIIKTFTYIDQKFKNTNPKIKILFIFDKNGYIKSYRFINYNNEFATIYKNIRLILASTFIKSFHDDSLKKQQVLYFFKF